MGHAANVREDSESKPDQAIWPDSLEKVLIELMVKEVQRGNKPSSTFTRKGWMHIEKGFYEKTNKRYGYSQLRNKFNQLRIRYQDFCKLLKEPGFIWDPSRNNLTASDAVWRSYRKAIKNMRRFRGKGCPMFNELRIIFRENCEADFQTANCSLNAEGANVEDGSSGASPSASPHNRCTCKDHHMVNVGCSHQRSATPTSHIQGKIEARAMAEGSMERTDITVPSTASTDMKGNPTKNEGGNPEFTGFSITNCVKCLESIEGVDSNTYLKAIKMFKDADWREMFMAMSAQRRLDWLASLN